MGLFTRKDKEVKPHKEIDIQKEIKKAEKEESLWIKCSSCRSFSTKKRLKETNMCA
jgi:acetyl-CoA carboxylase beta subunit